MIEVKEHDPIPESVAEAIRQWDSDYTVFTIEMGGLGPGYEMAIQGLAFELMRELNGFSAWDDKEELERENVRLDSVVSRCDKEPWGGFSGAQVGAAKNIAACVCRRGYRAAMRDPDVSNRLIQVNKKDLRTAKQMA